MRSVRAFFTRLGSLFPRERRERELAEELAAHIALHTEENLRAGLTAEEARRRALLRLGGIEQTKEAYRQRRGLPLLETFWQDLRFAARMLRKNPGFTAVAVLTLAMGIGANTALFSIVNAVILRPLPYKDSSRLVAFNTKAAMFPAFSLRLTWPAVQELRQHAASLERMAECWETERTVTGMRQPAVLTVAAVSGDFFELFGSVAQLGRLLSDQDEQPGQDQIAHVAPVVKVAIISDQLWRTRFASDPKIVGRNLILDQKVYVIAGVASQEFAFPEKVDAWLPLSLTPDLEQNPAFFAIEVFGKLRHGARLETLQSELNVIAQRLSQQVKKEKPELEAGYSLSAQLLLDDQVQDARQSYLMLLAAATLVLLIACANLTSLLLARGWGRHREMALRAAIGASPGRLQRQCMVESCLLALLGGAVGIGIAAAGIQAFRVMAPEGTARLGEVSTDWTLIWFALASALVSGALFGWIPARRAARLSPNELLKFGTGGNIAGRSRFGSALVVSEVALAFVLLIGCTLMMQTLANLLHQSPGFRTDHLLTFDLPQAQPQSRRGNEALAAAQIAHLQQTLTEIRALPGVESVGAADHTMLNGAIYSNAGLQLEGTTLSSVGEGVAARSVSPGYFKMLGVQLVRGREFDERDAQNAYKVIIVNETMARKFWGTPDILGKRISVSKDGNGNPEWNEVVGVVANLRDASIQVEPDSEYYLSLFQWNVYSSTVIVRTRTPPVSLADTISRLIWEHNPDQPLTHITTLTQTIAESVGDQRLHTELLGIFAGVGLSLALLGVYGVVSYSVVRRTQEIGVRVALGAGKGEVLRMVLRQGLTLVAIGAAIGVAGAIVAVRVIAGELYGVKPGDPWTYAAGIALILLVGCVACWIPAQRAMRVDPMVALRHE